MLSRTEFGVERTSCSCDSCQRYCRFMPGFLIPSDLGRLVQQGEDLFQWAERNLLASPGALVAQDGRMFRIFTLVPAVRADGSCMYLRDGRCAIHSIAPFGCAFFGCGAPRQEEISQRGLMAVHRAWLTDHLYARLWFHLFCKGLRQEKPESLRQRMKEEVTNGKVSHT